MQNVAGVLLFDGVCNLCNKMVQFIITHDKSAKIKFASLQSSQALQLLNSYSVNPTTFDSLVYIKAGKLYIRSSAVLHILKDLGGFWKLFYAFIIIPEYIRDLIYKLIAKNRYRIFGKREQCTIPDEKISSRFL